MSKSISKQEKQPLVTIIVGMYKGEKYLKECIESIINQTYKNLEIILVDDGTPDKCGEIADEYANTDNRIKVIHQKNSGVSTSRNNGLDIAKGEYVCIIDQDDCISSDYVQYFYNLIKINNADISLTRHPFKFFDLYKEEQISKEEKIQIWTAEKATIEMLYHKVVIAPWNKMISRKLIEENKIRFNPDFFGGEGFAFSIDCYQRANKIAVGQRKVYYYRVGNPESGASKYREKMIYSSIEAQKYIKSNFVEETIELDKSWIFSNWHTYCDCLNVMVGCKATKENKELYNQLKRVCQKDAFCALKAPVSAQQKLRGILFKINPFMASKIINHFRIRKFKREGAKQ